MTDKPSTLEMIKEVTQRSVPQNEGGSALTQALLRAAERKQDELKKGEEFDESKHRRDEDGKFAPKGGGASMSGAKGVSDGYTKLHNDIQRFAGFKPKAVFSLMPEDNRKPFEQRWKSETKSAGWFNGHSVRANAIIKIFNEDVDRMQSHLGGLVKKGVITAKEKDDSIDSFQERFFPVLMDAVQNDRWDVVEKNYDDLHSLALGFTGPKGKTGMLFLGRSTNMGKSDEGDMRKADNKYGAIDRSYKEKPGWRRQAFGAIDHMQGGPIGMYMGGVHANNAAKLRQKLGGSPEKTPKDLKGGEWRAIGALTAGSVGSAVGALGGAAAGAIPAYAMARRGNIEGARRLSTGLVQAGGAVGGIHGMVEGHRRVRDSQIWQRDYLKNKDFDKSDYGMPLAKRWR